MLRTALVTLAIVGSWRRSRRPRTAAVVADSGALRADVTGDPWGLQPGRRERRARARRGPLHRRPGRRARSDSAAPASGTTRPGCSAPTMGDGGYVAELATNDPAGRRISLRLRPTAEGVIGLDAEVVGVGPPVEAFGIGFGARADERYLGFGERSQAVDQRGNVVENYVADGPYQPDEWRPDRQPSSRPGASARATDATYYPVPWLLSTAGYGVLVDSPETSYFRLDQARLLERRGGQRAARRAHGGRRAPAAALQPQLLRRPRARRRARAVHRASPGASRRAPAPWVFGPWVQPTGGTDEQLALLDGLQEADAPLSVAQTYLHYLPCGAQRGRRDAEQARTAGRARARPRDHHIPQPDGLHRLRPGLRPGGGERRADRERARRSPTCSSTRPPRPFQVAEFDFTSPAGRAAYALGRRRGDRRRPRRLDGGLRRVHAARLADRPPAMPGPCDAQPLSARLPLRGAEAIADAPRPVVALPALRLDRRRARARRWSGAATRRPPGTSTACARRCARR